MGVRGVAVEVGAVAGVGHAVAGAVGVVGVVGVAGRAFTRIRGSGPAADPGRVGEAEIGTLQHEEQGMEPKVLRPSRCRTMCQ